MASQPYYRPLERTMFFADGRSARPAVPGTIPRGQPLHGSPIVTGRTDAGTTPDRTASAISMGASDVYSAIAALIAASGPAAEYFATFPFAIDQGGLERGQERYTIYCALCHDALGTGHGKIVERGYLQPPSYHTDYSRGFERRGIKLLLRDAPVGYYFEVITNGFGGMPDYATQVPREDRWKIIAYIRALQLSQNARLADMPAAERQKTLAALEGKP
jgi:mono/diheme cytochrome c family protein